MLGKGDTPLIAHVPGAKGSPYQRINAGHFIQEDQSKTLARITLD